MVSCMAIDDDPLFLKLLSSYFLEIKSAELIGSYTNPVNGVMAVAKQNPTVLLLDLDMPYLDGLEALTTLDRIPKIIVISGSWKLDGQEIHVDKFLSKSELNSPQVLEEAIKAVL